MIEKIKNFKVWGQNMGDWKPTDEYSFIQLQIDN